ncbi:hypothetical protein GCM10023334_046310 [Nonomuraea thailandensis]
MSGGGVITFAGRGGGRTIAVTGGLSKGMVFAGGLLPPRRPLPDAAQVPGRGPAPGRPSRRCPHVATWSAYLRLLTHARTALPLDSPGLQQILDYLDDSGDRTTGPAIQRDTYAHHLHASGPEHPDTLATRRQRAHRTGQAEEQGATSLLSRSCAVPYASGEHAQLPACGCPT